MATASITNTFVAGTAAEAAEVNTNFTDLVTFLNNSVVHTDGAKAMSGNFDAGSNRLTNVATATAVTDAAVWGQVAGGNYEELSSGVIVSTSGTTVDTIDITVPSAGMALVAFYGTLTCSGVTFPSTSSVGVSITASGSVSISAWSTTLQTNTTSAVEGGVIMVPLSAGANTITLTGTRSNNADVGGPASGGTATVNSGFKTAIIGVF